MSKDREVPLFDGKEMAIYDDPVDHMEPPAPDQRELASVMHRLIVWQICGGTQDRIAARTLVLAQSLGVDLGPTMVTEADIGRACKVTRQAVSLMVNELRDQFGLSNHNQRTERNREQCRKAHK